MPTLPSGQTATCVRTQTSFLGGPAWAPSPRVCARAACSVWAVVSDLPADRFPSFEADKSELAKGLLFCENLKVSTSC